MLKFLPGKIFNKLVHLVIIIITYFAYTNTGQAQENNGINVNKIRTVVIDPGHGGKDIGAPGKTTYEKDVVLAIGLKLGKYINENIPDVKVVYTRTTDEFIPLHQRAQMANDAKADLFISLHANSNPNTDPFGTSTHVLGLHRANENFEVAKRENSVILLEEDYSQHYENFDPNSPESYIIFTLLQNVYFDQSISFAGMVQDQFRDRAQRKDRGVKQQGLLVLAQTSMPGVLIETGFISNPDEEKYLNSEQGQELIASAIFRAFKDYKNRIESNSGSVLAETEKNTKSIPSQTIAVADSETIKQPNIEDSKNSITNLYFKVQVSSSSTSIQGKNLDFEGFDSIEEFMQNGIFKYAVGQKYTYNEALEYCKTIKNKYPDAFIIAIKNGEIISLQEAIKEQNQ